MNPHNTETKRVFCIGFNKTGTTTMKRSFELLGLTPIAAPRFMSASSRKLIKTFYQDRNYEPLLTLAENYRSFEDRPWNMWDMYRHLDDRFPDSLFILTVRDPVSWWRSVERWVTVNKPHSRKIYKRHLGVAELERDACVASYLRYNEEVSQYFQGRDNLLKIDIEAGEGWETLCQFLRLPIPGHEFPHVNRQPYDRQDEEVLATNRLMERGITCQVCNEIVAVDSVSPNRHRNVSLLKRRVRRFITKCWDLLRESVLGAVKGLFYCLHLVHRVISTRSFTGRPARNSPRSTVLDPFELGVVSCLFNPGGSRRRVENFRAFQAAISSSGVPHLVVELAFGSTPFQLEARENVIQLRSQDVMWHKERLLNIGIRRLLSQGYRKIAWLDGDIAFDREDWPVVVADTLDSVNLCQVFSTIAVSGKSHSAPEVGSSAVKYFLEKESLYSQSPLNLEGLLKGRLGGGQTGFGWAARAEVLQKVELFDKAIVGGGDKLIFAASLASDRHDPRFAALTHSRLTCKLCGHQNLSPPYTEYFLEWAERWATAVGFQVGYADLHISDMYHGDRELRSYHSRREIMYKYEFDPIRDLSEDDMGCLSWREGMKPMHTEVANYFLSRREDV